MLTLRVLGGPQDCDKLDAIKISQTCLEVKVDAVAEVINFFCQDQWRLLEPIIHAERSLDDFQPQTPNFQKKLWNLVEQVKFLEAHVEALVGAPSAVTYG
ncbi:hypothetical protein NDU88_003855 [Pleurodeles waltl]|uniref:Uncharacterized protein n=1 Tax=Pleurodeles waltl TaxID=8319 RepID=A0AAV7LGF1_PLEWA|nr:hypothetical protein NDU88_003855 [Pleurodeles waltl]